MADPVSARAETVDHAQADTVRPEEILIEISRESHRLAQQCGSIQRTLSAILDIVHHPDIRAEIHKLQDIDRIQQTLSDIAAILAVTGSRANGPPILKDEIGAAIHLESLRLRLGLSKDPPRDGLSKEDSDITWL